MSQQQNTAQGVSRIFAAEIDPSLTHWNLPAKEWLRMHGSDISTKVDGLATGNIVFNEEGKVLVIQRASNDSMPNRWEIPGGAVDDEDPSVFEGSARELWEEAGLVAKRFNHVVTEGPDQKPGQVYPNSTRTKTWCRFSFDVQVESCEHVKLDPKEHQAFAWATEEEIRDQLIGDCQHPITNKHMQALLLEAFRLRKEIRGTGKIATNEKEVVS
jgi:8-oxo-dGTP pyrophosphatase MutT (NUDIX family)